MKLGKQIVIQFILMFLTGIIGYLLRITFARNLSVSQYGLFYAVYSFVFFFAPFRDLGLTESTIYHINKYIVKKDNSSIKTIMFFGLLPQIILGIIFAIIFILSSKYLAINYFKIPNAQQIIIILAVLFSFDTIIPTISNIFLAFTKAEIMNTIQFIKQLSILLTAYFLFQLGKSVNYAAISYFVGTTVCALLSSIVFKLTFKEIISEKIKWKKKYINELFNYAIPIMLSTAGGVLLVYSDTIILTIIKGAKAVGYYNIALPILQILIIFLGPFTQVLFPKVSNWYHSKRKNTIEKATNLIYNYILTLTLPLAIIFASFPKLAITTLFGAKYNPAATTLSIFSMGFIFLALRNINFSIIAGIGKAKERSKIIFIGAFSNIILDLVLIPKFGIEGAALATILGYAIMAYLTTNLISKAYKIKLNYKMQIKTIISGIIFYVLIILLRKILNLIPLIEAIVIVLISGSIYILTLFIFKIITVEKINEFLRIAKTNTAKL